VLLKKTQAHYNTITNVVDVNAADVGLAPDI
jgi:hypothetical protein